MIDLIVFRVGTNQYAIKIENILRIIQAQHLTGIPNSSKFVDGMMSYEGRVIKVLNFRRLIGIASYEDELKMLFTKLRADHTDWVEALKTAVNVGNTFNKTTNPHHCELGKWIDTFNSYDDTVSTIFSELVDYHKQLHNMGADICEMKKKNLQSAKKMTDVALPNIFGHTMGALDTFIKQLDLVSNSLQKLIIYENNSKTFAIKVDVIEDIAHIEEKQIINSNAEEESIEYLTLDGILDLDGNLINVIKTVQLPI
jgi:chemotaxis signal transduction protein